MKELFQLRVKGEDEDAGDAARMGAIQKAYEAARMDDRGGAKAQREVNAANTEGKLVSGFNGVKLEKDTNGELTLYIAPDANSATAPNN